MSLDDNEKDDDMGVENPLGIGLEEAPEIAEKNPHDQLTVAAALGCIAGKDRFADVWFVVGTGKDQRRIPGHRVILAASSDLFEAMLYPIVFPGDSKDSKDGKPAPSSSSSSSSSSASAMPAIGVPIVPGGMAGLEDPKELEIEIPDVKPHIFRLMLASIYGDKADIKADDLPDLIQCAKKFQVESLRLLCVKFMTEGVTVENACRLFDSAERMLNEKTFALPFIEDNATEVIASPSFDQLRKERVMTILKSSKLAIDEIDLFKGVLRWTLSECKRNGVKDTLDNKKEILKDMLPLIRFPVMSMEDVATFVSPSQILSPSQLLEVFTYLGQPESRKPKVSFPTAPRAGNSERWTLEPTLKSGSVQLSKKNMSASNASVSHSYCLGSVAWTKGVHCWRVTRDAGPSQWLLLGVSRKEGYPDTSYNAAGFYGMSSANQQYRAGAAQNSNSNFMNGPLDVKFDADTGTLSVHNLSNGQNHEMSGLPKGMPLCPHFGPHSAQQITVAPIRVKDYGKKK